MLFKRKQTVLFLQTWPKTEPKRNRPSMDTAQGRNLIIMLIKRAPGDTQALS